MLDDPRVQPYGSDEHEVTTDSGDAVRVLPNDVMGWGLYTGERLELVLTEHGPAIGYASVEAAITAVLA
jgi:hypothetical protein